MRGTELQRMILVGLCSFVVLGCDEKTGSAPAEAASAASPSDGAAQVESESGTEAAPTAEGARNATEEASAKLPASLKGVARNPDLSCGAMNLELPEVEYQRSSCPAAVNQARFFGLSGSNDKVLELTLSFPESPLEKDFSNAELELSRQTPVGKRTWTSSSCQVTPEEQYLDASFGWHYVKMKVDCKKPLESTTGDKKDVVDLSPFSMTGIFKQPE